jgi:uncharacterized tellurite resistance protein B-like protein
MFGLDDREKLLSQLNIVVNILTDSYHIAESECGEIINQLKQFSEASSELSSFTVS